MAQHIMHHKHKRIDITHPIDALALLSGTVQPLTVIPQIWLVYTTQDASSVSMFMWTGFNLGSAIMIFYSIKHKLRPILISQIIWVTVQTPMMLAPLIFM